MRTYFFIGMLVIFFVALLIAVGVSPHDVYSQTPANLAYQADIYGSSSLETIEYNSDLQFYSWGGFGVNAHVFRARLRSGDEIAYAVSANDPYAFTLNVTPISGTPVTLTVTNSEYSLGGVKMASPSELHFEWAIQEEGLNLILHRHAELVPDPRVTVQNVVYEEFSIENLGPSFVLNTFSEYLHMDDRARVRDFDSDGRNETLLSINDYSSSFYPIFGKVYLNRPNIDSQFISDGRYATISQDLLIPFASGIEQSVTKAAYVSSTARNGVTAEQQVAVDALVLLKNEHKLILRYPFDVPKKSARRSPLGLITSYFDHEYPKYTAFPNNRGAAAGNITLYWGERRGAGTSEVCNRLPKSDNVCYDGHDGYDFEVNSEILAAADGKVSYVGCYDTTQNPPSGLYPCSKNQGTKAKWIDGLGLMVTISHSNGYETTYGHMSVISVTQGITVTRGYTLGVAGNTGLAKGVHLHFSVYRNGITDPYGWIPGEVAVDPNTQPITDTKTGKSYVGVPSSCLWESGCPTTKWVDPSNGAELTLGEDITLTVPAGSTGRAANFTLVPRLDTLADSFEVPAGYSFIVRAWDTQGNSVAEFSEPLFLAVNYDDSATALINEETLSIFRWDTISSHWQPLTTTLNTGDNLAVVALPQLSTFSLRGEPLFGAPVIGSISPNRVPDNDSTLVTIAGSNFREGSRVWLANSLLNSTYLKESAMQATVPAWLNEGDYTIRVENPDYQEDMLVDAVEVYSPFIKYLPAISK